MILVFIVIASALGGAARYALSGFVSEWMGPSFPWGTLAVNISGSLVIGLFIGATGEGFLVFQEPTWHHVVTFGFLGGYTTFSSFSLETLNLVREGEIFPAALYVAGTVVACLVAVALGYSVSA